MTMRNKTLWGFQITAGKNDYTNKVYDEYNMGKIVNYIHFQEYSIKI